MTACRHLSNTLVCVLPPLYLSPPLPLLSLSQPYQRMDSNRTAATRTAKNTDRISWIGAKADCMKAWTRTAPRECRGRHLEQAKVPIGAQLAGTRHVASVPNAPPICTEFEVTIHMHRKACEARQRQEAEGLALQRLPFTCGQPSSPFPLTQLSIPVHLLYTHVSGSTAGTFYLSQPLSGDKRDFLSFSYIFRKILRM